MQTQIASTSDKIQKDVNEQNERLEVFEQRLEDIKISDSDQFYLNKEINRFKNSLNAIESSKDFNIESSKEIQDNEDKKLQDEQIQILKNNFKQLSKLAE